MLHYWKMPKFALDHLLQCLNGR
uniref:Uncharacterized protein n=1 Tax=Arundo donax TaxID=35708 RepID=A0A0A9B1M6_ARUDO